MKIELERIGDEEIIKEIHFDIDQNQMLFEWLKHIANAQLQADRDKLPEIKREVASELIATLEEWEEKGTLDGFSSAAYIAANRGHLWPWIEALKEKYLK